MWIGRESVIMPGVKIGDGAIIAAYSVVVKDVPAYTVYGGNPATLIKKRFDDELTDLLLRFRWWDYAPEKLVESLPLLCDPDLTKVKKAIQERFNLTPSFGPFPPEKAICYSATGCTPPFLFSSGSPEASIKLNAEPRCLLTDQQGSP